MSAHAVLLGLTAAIASGRVDTAGGVLSVAVAALFLPLAAAVSLASHAALRVAARRRAIGLGIAELALGALALTHGPLRELMWLGLAGVPIGAAYAAARSRLGARAVVTELVAIGGICLLAPATWLLCAGDVGPWTWSAVGAFLSFGGTVPYVRERVRRRRTPDGSLTARLRGGRLALGWQALSIAVALGASATGLIGSLVVAAFVPGAVKTAAGIARRESKPPIKHIGYLETAVSTVFAVLAGIGLGLAS